MRRQQQSTAGTILLHAATVLLVAVAIVPFAWLLCASFKRGPDLFTSLLLPWDDLTRLTTANYARVLNERPFLRWVVNSLFLASTQTILVVTLSSLAGFALAKYRFHGRRAVMLVMFLTVLLPAQVLLPSLYELIVAIGWIDTYRAILVPSAVSVFGVFLFRQAMLGVPDELLQAGRVDGCSELRLWWDVVMPMVRPMTAAYTLLSFLATWNSFLWPQIVLQSPTRYHLPIGLSNMLQLPQYQTEYGVLMAGTVLGILPVVLLFFALQRDLVGAMTSGAVQG